MNYTHFVGLDLGQTQDFSAACVLEEQSWVSERAALHVNVPKEGWYSPADLTSWQTDQATGWATHFGRPSDPLLAVRHLERLPLGTSYPNVMEYIKTLVTTPPLTAERSVVVIDQTGVGRGVVDFFLNARLPVAIVPVTITGGSTVSGDRYEGFHVAKRVLIGAAQVALQTRLLKIAAELPHAATLTTELANMRVKVSAAANELIDTWRQGQHDDLALALALSVWFRGWYGEYLDRLAREAHAHHEEPPSPPMNERQRRLHAAGYGA